MLVEGCTSSASRLGMTGGENGSSGEAATSEEDPVIPNLEALLREHPSKILIVGCGKYPERWQSSTGVKAEPSLEGSGDHTHKGCITLAEDSNIEPHIVHDWTQPIPKALHEKFQQVYLEHLPFNVLNERICMQNLFDALAPGGIGYIDLVTNHFQEGEGSDHINQAGPFTLPSEESLLNEGKMTIEEDGSITMTGTYQKEVLGEIKAFMNQFGFSNVLTTLLPINPFNGRAMDPVIIVKKPLATPKPQ